MSSKRKANIIIKELGYTGENLCYYENVEEIN